MPSIAANSLNADIGRPDRRPRINAVAGRRWKTPAPGSSGTKKSTISSRRGAALESAASASLSAAVLVLGGAYVAVAFYFEDRPPAGMSVEGVDIGSMTRSQAEEHLRTELTDELRPYLEDLDLAIGMWRPQWLPPDAPAGTWRVPGYPAGFAPAERVLVPVGPWPEPSPRPLRRAAEGARKGATRVAESGKRAGRSLSSS